MDRRNSPRSPTNREIVARIPATPIQARILNLSTSGCLAEAQSSLIQAGRTILLIFSAANEIAGTVVWQGDGQLGVKFTQELSGETVSRLVAAEVERSEHEKMRDRFGRALPALPATFRIV